MAATVLRLRYAATCVSCSGDLPKGAQAQWNREQKTATCLPCLSSEVTPEIAIDRGKAGASALHEFKKRHDRREQNIRDRYGKLSGVVLALSDDPQPIRAWQTGGHGEGTLGGVLDPLRKHGIAVLHDRRMPGSRANIDHIAITSTGVFVIDAKKYKGRVECRDRGKWLTTDYRLYVGGRDKSDLLGGMTKQATAVREVLGRTDTVPIYPVVCFVAADWSLFAKPMQFGVVKVTWPKELVKQLRNQGTTPPDEIARIERQLALALPPAATSGTSAS